MGVREFLVITVIITCLAPGITPAPVITSGSPPPQISKQGCRDNCGNVGVPFPFGMGDSKCFLDQSYEMVCDESVYPHKLIHKQLQLQVLSISLFNMFNGSNDWIMVKAPISYYNCQGKQTPKAVNLTGAPFSFSDGNLFVAASCGALASMSWSSGNIFSQIGCSSTCSTQNYNNVSCEGIGCCQTPITSINDLFEISFTNSTSTSGTERQGSGDRCKLAFVVDADFWHGHRNTSSSFSRIREMGYVPLKLDWNLVNYSYFDVFKEHRPWEMEATNSYSRRCDSFSSSFSASPPLSCSCPAGLLGNPYLPEGCTQDLNECEDKEYDPCSHRSGSICVNTHGSYRCSFKRKILLISFVSSFGALFLLFGTWGSYKKIKKTMDIRRKKKFFKRNGGLLLQQQLSSSEGTIEKTKLFSSDELDKATLHFSADRIIGHGGQGTVYKGMLDDGKIVAVKKSKIVDEAKLSEFINEVVILSQINHRNVVQLLGCCLETQVPILVYEFIPNGTLYQYINEQNEEFPFTWKMRLRIATEVAGALSYLHSAASFPIYHRDIKSKNILLDEKYRAKVADFGTSRTIALEQTHLTTLVYGTFGYLDPEYFQSSQFTEKSDVYSFGVVLVELLTGEKVICATRAKEGLSLATYFTMSMESNSLFDIIDPKVIEEGKREDILIVACLALRCLNLNGRNRPTMKEVALQLEGLQKTKREAQQENQEEMEYMRTESYGAWHSASLSTTGSSVVFDNTITRSPLQSELPLLSFESK